MLTASTTRAIPLPARLAPGSGASRSWCRERRLGFEGPPDFDVHPTNHGHTFIAQQFREAWLALQ
jgi:hypothetical protein